MKALRKLAFASVLAALALGLGLGCGATFDPPTEIKTLRILGVSKDKPYAEPGDVVTLSMLWYDGGRGARRLVVPDAGTSAEGGAAGMGPLGEAGAATNPTRRQVKLTWLGGCINPPADSYSGCFAQYAQALASGAVLPVDGVEPAALPTAVITVGTGSHFSVKIPTDAELGRPLLHPSQDPRLPNYGISYVFFALCAGDLAPGDEHFPVHCQDSAGHDLGPDDFVLGYSAIYFFAHGPSGEPYLNANPVTTGLKFGPKDVSDVTCFGDACLGSCTAEGCQNAPAQPINRDDFPTLYLPACKDDGDSQKCPPHDLRLDINPATFELDQVSDEAYGRGFKEQMWIDYYSTRGRFRSATKLLNDATKGYNPVNGTQFYAPKEPGPVDLWIVVHDNRGGVSWAGTTLMIE
jgi:hypothetical protein